MGVSEWPLANTGAARVSGGATFLTSGIGEILNIRRVREEMKEKNALHKEMAGKVISSWEQRGGGRGIKHMVPGAGRGTHDLG